MTLQIDAGTRAEDLVRHPENIACRVVAEEAERRGIPCLIEHRLPWRNKKGVFQEGGSHLPHAVLGRGERAVTFSLHCLRHVHVRSRRATPRTHTSLATECIQPLDGCMFYLDMRKRGYRSALLIIPSRDLLDFCGGRREKELSIPVPPKNTRNLALGRFEGAWHLIEKMLRPPCA